jgi:predicted acetyltransferase
MAKLRLVKPTAELSQSHAELVGEFKTAGEELVPWVLDEVGSDFNSYLSWLEDQSRGIRLNEGFVPNSTFWLVSNGEIVGVINLRHKLTPQLEDYGGHAGYGVKPSARRQGYATKMLELGLVELDRMGITRVRITCAKNNIASAKTIVANGGVLETEEHMPEHGQVIQRYWIHRGSPSASAQ